MMKPHEDRNYIFPLYDQIFCFQKKEESLRNEEEMELHDGA